MRLIIKIPRYTHLSLKRNYTFNLPIREPASHIRNPKASLLLFLCLHRPKLFVLHSQGLSAFIHRVRFIFLCFVFRFLFPLHCIGRPPFFFFTPFFEFSLLLLLFFPINKVCLLSYHHCFSFLLLMSDSLPTLFFFSVMLQWVVLCYSVMIYFRVDVWSCVFLVIYFRYLFLIFHAFGLFLLCALSRLYLSVSVVVRLTMAIIFFNARNVIYAYLIFQFLIPLNL